VGVTIKQLTLLLIKSAAFFAIMQSSKSDNIATTRNVKKIVSKNPTQNLFHKNFSIFFHSFLLHCFFFLCFCMINFVNFLLNTSNCLNSISAKWIDRKCKFIELRCKLQLRNIKNVTFKKQN
jgi:hypothetical protein